MALTLLVLLLASVAGAWLAVRVRQEELHWAWLYVPSLVSATAWIRLTRSDVELPVAAALFDVLFGLTFWVALVAFGQRMTGWQVAGAVMAVGGLALVGWGR